MSILRIYDPPECDSKGVPLDWDECRTCAGEGYVKRWDEAVNAYEDVASRCPTCDGHGSLKAAALHHLRYAQAWGRVAEFDPQPVTIQESNALHRGFMDEGSTRCEDCGHPMSEGTWTPSGGRQAHFGFALHELRGGREPNMATERTPARVHYSPCDEGCRHGYEHQRVTNARDPMPLADGRKVVGRYVEQSWRPVDVRTLGWPHDLRPEKLSILCLRCFAARTP